MNATTHQIRVQDLLRLSMGRDNLEYEHGGLPYWEESASGGNGGEAGRTRVGRWSGMDTWSGEV